MITVQALFPLLDGITAVLLSGLEVIKGYFGVKISEYRVRMQQIASCADEEIKMNPIGFDYKEEENANE